jgi:hypothetical protein
VTRALTSIALCACLFAIARGAVAGSDADHAAAVESFRRGTQLVEAGKLQDAIDAFREALRREPSSVGARLDLADCYEKIGAPGSAWREYAIAEEYARRANDDRRAMARTSAGALEGRLFVLVFQGRAAPSTSVRVDGDEVPPEILARGSVALAPGPHHVEVFAPGTSPRIADAVGKAGERRPLVLAFDADAPVTTAPPAPQATLESPESPPAERGSSQRTLAYVVGGVGVASLAAGAVTGIVAASKKSTLDSESKDSSIGAARFYDDRSSAKTFATASTITLAAGGGLLLVGSILFFTAPSSSPSRPVGLRILPTLGGVRVDATF